MLTAVTQAAIAILQDISLHGSLQMVDSSLNEEETSRILHCLEQKDLIHLLPSHEEGAISSYELRQPLCNYTLLQVLEALDEPIKLNQPTPESYYMHHCVVAQKIGVFNNVARHFLTDIKISDW